HIMLAKCAEALALRRAFPAEMSGLYTADEIRSGADELPAAPPANPITGEIVDAPARATREQLSDLRDLWRRSADLGRPAPARHLTLDLETLSVEQIAKLADQARGWIAQARETREAEPTPAAA
ncbi:MAG TPA: recombinase RecT, partial [Burkholderiaceae bacterium]|nr:recombinase RecT [Burkholderiaceae bacterium]